jgi:hypothetical protein
VQVVENNQVAHKPVEPGARGEWARETWVAVGGLQPGAVVIKGHVGPLRPGSAVKFTGPPPQPSPKGGGSRLPSP